MAQIRYSVCLGGQWLLVLPLPSAGIHQAFQELQNSAIEQRVAFAEIFNRVAFLHRFVVGESNALYSVFFHLLSGVTALLLTSSQRTARARWEKTEQAHKMPLIVLSSPFKMTGSDKCRWMIQAFLEGIHKCISWCNKKWYKMFSLFLLSFMSCPGLRCLRWAVI